MVVDTKHCNGTRGLELSELLLLVLLLTPLDAEIWLLAAALRPVYHFETKFWVAFGAVRIAATSIRFSLGFRGLRDDLQVCGIAATGLGNLPQRRAPQGAIGLTPGTALTMVCVVQARWFDWSCRHR